MPFDFDTPSTFIEKANKAIDWIVEEIFRQKNWRSLLMMIDVILFLALNPFQQPFPNLLTPFSQLLSYGWYRPAFWSLVSLITADLSEPRRRTTGRAPFSRSHTVSLKENAL